MTRAFCSHLRNGNGLLCNSLLLSFVMLPALCAGSLRLYLESWVSLPLQQQKQPSKLWIFGALTGSTLITGGLASILLIYIFLKMSRTLHNKMLWRVARAPMTFFLSNPVGRVLNRFSKDTVVADQILVKQSHDFFEVSENVLISLVRFVQYCVRRACCLRVSQTANPGAFSGGSSVFDGLVWVEANAGFSALRRHVSLACELHLCCVSRESNHDSGLCALEVAQRSL